jgi:hypothetical protein
MKTNLFTVLLFILLKGNIYCQTYPTFGNETPVTINGLTFDAMEPSLSTDGNALFFNSLNDGITTSLYYASKVNDSVFNYVGLVPIINQTITPRLDAVASSDSSNNFYWVSLRSYPTYLENLYRIKFLNVGYTNYGKVYGDFYINQPGYLIMDATTNYYGNQLIYCNAYFNNCSGLPCKASMGIAAKINDSTFNKVINTSSLMYNVNDTVNYIVYAPHITKDGLELYYTRLLKTGTQTEIVVSVRTNTINPFSVPAVLVSSPSIAPEGPTLTSDKSKMYYHKKSGSLYKIFYQKRITPTSILELDVKQRFNIYPNPTTNFITLNGENVDENIVIELYSTIGDLLMTSLYKKTFDLSAFPDGIYILKVKQGSQTEIKKIIKNEW